MQDDDYPPLDGTTVGEAIAGWLENVPALKAAGAIVTPGWPPEPRVYTFPAEGDIIVTSLTVNGLEMIPVDRDTLTAIADRLDKVARAACAKNRRALTGLAKELRAAIERG